ncbi:MAG: LPS export ABC transporter periplasmic protein LptC [Bacteroidales bacterium]|jgi:LPS export ABC transporter protein LptC|nr:LPS export ABC transporter periplasmic protein LptC [Bacteroidales bacterium]
MKQKIFAYAFMIFLFGILIFNSCKNDPKDIARISMPDTIAGQFISEGEVIYSELGNAKLRIQAPVIYNFETSKSYTEMPQGFFAEFFDDDVNVEATIAAEYGIFLNDEDKMIAKYDVEVFSLKNEEQLNTEELIWDMKARKIYSDAFVKITSKDKIILGDGFESDENFENRSIKKLRGEFLVDQENE